MVVDVRLAGHDKFQSKETNSTDLGNNELLIYKKDNDAYSLNVIENTFDYVKFNFNVKDEYKDIISNIRVDGKEIDPELGYWVLEESKKIKITYDYYLKDYDISVNIEEEKGVGLVKYYKHPDYQYYISLDPNINFSEEDSVNKDGMTRVQIYIRIFSTGNSFLYPEKVKFMGNEYNCDITEGTKTLVISDEYHNIYFDTHYTQYTKCLTFYIDSDPSEVSKNINTLCFLCGDKYYSFVNTEVRELLFKISGFKEVVSE